MVAANYIQTRENSTLTPIRDDRERPRAAEMKEKRTAKAGSPSDTRGSVLGSKRTKSATEGTMQPRVETTEQTAQFQCHQRLVWGSSTKRMVTKTLALVILLVSLMVVDTQRPNSLYKVALTQKGYIQYLRYQVDVPELYDFTYCIWLRSDNFTFPQPIFSYSRHESERLVRGWLEDTRGGVLVQMAVRERPVMRVLTGIRPRTWHHVCQGWNPKRARWTLHLDGSLVATGVHPELAGRTVPGGGDLAVGQEVTDADRGLDDGIEGEVFGFNMVVGGGAEAGGRLARLGFVRCVDGLGAPAVAALPPTHGARMLVAWPFTPVGLFGGATVQPAKPMCGNF